MEKILSKHLTYGETKERLHSTRGKKMKECREKINLSQCNCSWEPCSRKGICCECLSYHWRNRELPACLFPDDVERTYDRSLRRFIQIYKNQL